MTTKPTDHPDLPIHETMDDDDDDELRCLKEGLCPLCGVAFSKRKYKPGDSWCDHEADRYRHWLWRLADEGADG